MKKLVLALLLGVGMAYFLITGCTAFNDAPAPNYDSGSAPPVPTSSGTTGSGCVRASVPSTAPPPDPAASGSIEIVVAMHTLSLGLADGGVAPDFGYDLDGVCSCKPDPSSCTNKLDAGHCDGDQGRDDGMGQVLAQFTSLIGDPSVFANDSVDGGVRGLIARIENYNGQANDDSVKFSLYRSPGTDGLPDFTNPDQAWKIDSADIGLSGGDPYASKTTASGFVKDHQLVVDQLASSSIPFNSDTDIQLQQVSITGTLAQNPDGHWRLDHAIGVGRWGQNDAIAAIAHIQDPTNAKQRICQAASFFGLLKSTVCQGADIVDTPSQDNQKQNCNALSTAIQIEMVPAKLGPIVTPTRQDACQGITLPTCD